MNSNILCSQHELSLSFELLCALFYFPVIQQIFQHSILGSYESGRNSSQHEIIINKKYFIIRKYGELLFVILIKQQQESWEVQILV